MGTAYYIHMNTQSSSLMINVATVNTKGISEDLSLIVKCCQIMVSEMMCQLLKLNNPCWSAVSDYNSDQRRGLIDTGKHYGTDNLRGSGVVDRMLGPQLSVLTPSSGHSEGLGTLLGAPARVLPRSGKDQWVCGPWAAL